MKNTIIVNIEILPDKMIHRGELYDIEPVDEESKKELTVRGFTIHEKEDGKIEKVILNCNFHPNCRHDTKELCLNPTILEYPVDTTLISMVCSSISTYNLDTAYQRPWGKINYWKSNNTVKIKMEG